MIKKSILLSSIILLLTFNGCSSEEKETQEINNMISKNEYVLTSTDSKQYIVKKEANAFILDGAKDKVIIFDIFATWCPPCRASASHLSSLQKKYKDNLVIIGITIEDNIENSKLLEFAKTYNAKYILVNSDQNRKLADAIVKELGLGDRYPIPTMAMYKNGKLINHFVGMVEEEFVESDIKKALGL
ncbi:MAG: thioredoxin [Sulfurimonas sp.]|nr:MAG: thioredoxin [Sulfurimonas sp.]